MTYAVADGNVREQYVHPPQQVVIEVAQLRILKASPPVIRHHLVIGLDGKEYVRTVLVGMNSQERIQQMDGFAEFTLNELVEYLS